MSEREIIERLAALQVDSAPQAREQAAVAAGELIGSGGVDRNPRRSWKRWLALGAVALVVGTPQGRALAEDVSELVGIGDRPSSPPIANPGSVIDSTVAAVGETPSGVRFEIAETASGPPGEPEKAVSCLQLIYPDLISPLSGASCLTRAAQRGLRRKPSIQPTISVGPEELGAWDVLVTATASPEIERVAVSYLDPATDERVEAEVTGAEFEPAPAAGSGGRSPELGTARYVAAFLPAALLGDRDELPDSFEPQRGQPGGSLPASVIDAVTAVELTGYGENGEVLARRSLSSRDAEPLGLLVAARDRPRTPEELAAAECRQELYAQEPGRLPTRKGIDECVQQR